MTPGVKLISPDYIAHARCQFLEDDKLEEFLDYCGRPLRKSIRINTLKITVDEAKAHFEREGFELTSIPWCPQGFWISALVERSAQAIPPKSNVEADISLGNLLEHLQGLFYIQEASSMLPPIALMHQQSTQKKSPLVLDLAAAPGSKTTQLAALLDNTGLIIANEMSASRTKILYANLVRCGVSNTCISQFDGNKFRGRLSNLFDYVLLDAPCGGEGTIRKDPNALLDWQLDKVQTLAKLQKELILTAYHCLKPGGRLVYSTCTLSKEENHQVAEYLITETTARIERLDDLFEGANRSVTSQGFLHVLPQDYDSEGFFVAAFNKPMSANGDLDVVTQTSPFVPLSLKTQSQIQDYYCNHFGLDILNLNKVLRQRDREVWLFPQYFDMVSKRVRLNRSGIKLAEIYPNKIRSSHEFAIALDDSIQQQKVNLTESQAEDFFKGRNLEFSKCDGYKDGEVLLTINSRAIGIGQLQKGKIKNLLPRDRVLDKLSLRSIF